MDKRTDWLNRFALLLFGANLFRPPAAYNYAFRPYAFMPSVAPAPFIFRPGY